ncbi:hypothetical protein Tco_0983721 [Tanacetum coccineum]
MSLGNVNSHFCESAMCLHYHWEVLRRSLSTRFSTIALSTYLAQRVPPSLYLHYWPPEVSPSPDYIPGPEEPQSPPPLDFVLEPMYPEYIPQEDEILPGEEQPLLVVASPTADPPGYVPEFDPEEEPEEDDEDPEEDPADYPIDRDDDDDYKDEDEEEEEEHPASADSVPPVLLVTAGMYIVPAGYIVPTGRTN